MARRAFFSFHYQRDIWRINQIRSVPNITGTAAAGFHDASLWEESKKKGDAVIKKMIDTALLGTTVTVVCIGNQSYNRKFINYEIEQSLLRGNGLVGIQIHHLLDHKQSADLPGIIPPEIRQAGYKVYKYTNVYDLAVWIEEAAKLAGK